MWCVSTGKETSGIGDVYVIRSADAQGYKDPGIQRVKKRHN
jgi:hypothetical protein